MKLSSVLGVLLCSCSFAAFAAYPGEDSGSALKTVAVAAFKNGLAFVVKQGEVRLEAGAGRLAPIPNATLGSLWLTPNDTGTSLEEVVAFRYKTLRAQSFTAMADVLLANAGKTVTVEYNSQKEYTGEIVGFKEAERPPAETEGSIVERGASSSYAVSSVSPQARVVPEYLLLKADGKLLALYFRSITRVTLPADTVLESKQEEEHKALRFKAKGATGSANLTMGYLEHGMSWTPSYLITLEDDKTAQITMQAVLVDDAEDLKSADVFFVVGVPNFAYSHITSPMALQQNLLEFMQAAARPGGTLGGLLSNAVMGQRTVSVADEFDVNARFAATVEELTGAPEEDLFLYSRGGVTLARGERATYNVFAASVGYEHLYEWEVPERSRVDAFGNAVNAPNTEGSDSAAANNVWHALRLKNSTKFPWTSAPALVLSSAKPIAQDTLPYTPKSATSNLKLTIATDIRAGHEEREVGRQQNLERRRGRSYDLVTVEGTLKIKNFKSKDVRLSIGKTLRGTVESQTDNGKAEKLGEAIQADNPISRLTWEILLKAGEERKITYRYKVWLLV